jgi:hypothetical protein
MQFAITNQGRRWALAFMSLLFMHFFIIGCRTAASNTNDSALESAEAKPWFDSKGLGAMCESTPATCSQFDDNKEFVDKCVKAGLQAKTCGCGVRCSGKVEMPQQSEIATDDSIPTVLSCPTASLRTMESLVSAGRWSNAVMKCATGHICAGHTVYCTPEQKQTTSKVRLFAKQNCRAEVLKHFCPDQFVESLICKEADIEKLSLGWKSAFLNEVNDSEVKKLQIASTKKCYQGFLCNGTAVKCDQKSLQNAKNLKAALENDGCEYWLKNFCSLGNQSL